MPQSSSRKTRLVGLFALLSLAMAVLIMGRPSFTNASRPPRGIPNAVVAIQVIQSQADVDAILGDAPSPDREVMRIKQYLDFGFIASYAGLFVSLAVLLASKGSWGRVAGLAAGISGAAAAGFDVAENIATLRILDIPLPLTTAAMLNSIRSASAAKWVLSAVTIALLSSYFLTNRRWTYRITGGLLAAGAALQAYGLANNVWLAYQGFVLGAAMIALVALFFRVR